MMSTHLGKLIIAVDCDGVLSDFVGRCAEVVAARHGVHFTVDQVTQWDFVTTPGWKKDFFQHCKEPGFVYGMQVLPGAVWGVDKLREFGRVICITSPFGGAPVWASEREAWLRDHFRFDRKDIVQCDDKSLITRAVLLDDNPENIQGDDLLIDRPWNQHAAGLVRACAWDTAVAYVRVVLNQ